MLSSRYLYLHQALGMGVMWLKQGAYVEAPSSPTVTHVNPTNVPKITAQEQVKAWQAMLPDNAQTVSKATPKTAIPTKTINPEIQELLSCSVYCISGSILWLSLSDKLDLSPDDALLYGDYGRLLTQLMASVGSISPSWQAFNIAQLNDWQEKILNLIKNDHIKSVILLGEYYQNNTDFISQLHQQKTLAHCIYLPHPAKLLRQPILKKSVWAKIKILVP